ncbi:MAG: acyl-ACP--UDP-N-acetylglucosamine O-acyltransferase, partial [Deferribacterales bacterium]
GLKRRGVPPEVRSELKKAYNILIDMNLMLDEVAEKIATLQQVKEVKLFLDFITKSKRGIMRRGE